MKRILSLILILILSLGVLSSCQWPGNDPVEPPVTEPVYNIDNAVSYLKTVHPELYPTKDMPVPETKADFHLLKVLSVKDGKYTISWSVDNEAIQIVDYVPANDKDIFTAETKCTVKVPANVSEDLTYTLTATITAPDGKTTKKVDHTLKVPAPVIVGGKATLDMMGTANITSYSTEKVVYTANGITYINEKAKSTTDCYNQTKDYAARAYAGSTIRIEFKGMRKIVITVDDYDGNGKTYMSGLDGMIVEGATITREHDIITIVFDEAVDTFQSTNLSSQIRIETIEVYTSLDGTEPDGGQDKPTGNYTAPALNTAFKLYIELPSGKVYFKGAMDSTYLATTTDVTAGVDIYFEEVDGGYHMYFMNGEAKTYINAAPYQKDNGYMGCHFELGEAPICTWTYDATYGIFEVTCEMEGVESDTFFAGTFGSYSTVSLSGSYYKPQIATGTQYPARLVLSSEAGTENPNPHEHSFVNGKCECGETDPNYQPPVTEGLAIVTAPEAGVAYKFGLFHGNESANVFFTGENYNNYAWYLAYTTDVAGAVDVYLETVEGVEGGYRLYFDNNGVKTYIVAFPRDGDTTKGTLKLDTVVPSEYYTFSAEHNTLIYTSTTGEQFYIGSSGTYKSISLSAISYIDSTTSYISHLYGEGTGEGGGETPAPHEHVFVNGECACGEKDPNYVPPSEGGDEGGDEGDDDGVMSIPEVLASAEGTAVVVKGTVSQIYQAWNEQYSNISFYIVDEAGNRLLVFRTGTLVGIGDQVTVTGTATLYNEVIQIAQGGVTVIDVKHVCSDFTEATCQNLATCKVCGTTTGELADHNIVDGVCSVCGKSPDVTYITASKTMKELISALGWTDSTTKQTFTLDDNVTVAVNGGNNTGKAYSGDHIRIYATDSPAGTLTISVPEGYELVSVKVTTATGTYAFLCVDGSSTDISNETTSISGNSVVLNSVKNGSDGKQVRVMAIEVVYYAK